jgi:hypothetical protein
MPEDASPEKRREEINARALERLQKPEVQEALAKLVTDYYVDFRYVVTQAEVESEGVRPEGLTNEVYACFHHITRGLSEEDESPVDEVEKGQDTHLKRLALDAHKIVINRVLKESYPILSAIDFLMSRPELPQLIEGGYERLNEVRIKRQKVKELYLSAKRLEGRGKNHAPLEKYGEALECAILLRDEVDELSDHKQFIYALRRDEEDRKNRARALKISKRAFLISIVAAIAALISAVSLAKRTFFGSDTSNTQEVAPEVVP